MVKQSKFQLSYYGEQIASNQAPIALLMKDLTSPGKALRGGGGNPRELSKVSPDLYEEFLDLVTDKKIQRQCNPGRYPPPEGDMQCRKTIANLYKRLFHWNISEENVILTNGSQSAVTLLLHMFTGPVTLAQEKHKQAILQVLFHVPDYVGYSGLAQRGAAIGIPSKMQSGENHELSFGLNVDGISTAIEKNRHLNTICLSNPTNPTGTVLTDDEIRYLEYMCHQNGILLIWDAAYNLPFGSVQFAERSYYPDPTRSPIIYVASASKVGFPEWRLGYIICPNEIAEHMLNGNASHHLSGSTTDSAVKLHLITETGLLERISTAYRNFYRKRLLAVADIAREVFRDLDWSCTQGSESTFGGSFFQFYRFELDRGTMVDVQKSCKRQNPPGIIIPGSHFAPGMEGNYPSVLDYCMRLNCGNESIENLESLLEMIKREIERRMVRRKK